MPDSEKCWALLERVAASSQLRRATRLQELLFYMGKRSLKDGCDRVHEQEIGAQVFGRPESYDTTIDNIVRTNVSDLRKRIEAYFNSEGHHEKLIMEIPRGSYVPVFRYRSAESENGTSALPDMAVPAMELPAVTPVATPIAEPRRRIPGWRTVVGFLILTLAIGCALFYWSRYRVLHQALYAWQEQPSVDALWSRILSANPQTDIVLSDASIGLVQTLSQKTFPLKDYLGRSYLGQLQGEDLSADMHTAVNRILAWNLGSPDEFALARRILALDPLSDHLHLYNARYYMPDLIRRDSVILIGARKSNPWAELFEDRTNFITRFGNNGVVTVENQSPAVGEQKTYTQTEAAEYCVVAYLPSTEHNGVALLIEGTDAEATEAAGDFLLSEAQLSNFRKMLHVNHFPYFEVLLKVSSVRGTPLTATVNAYRIYPSSH